MTLWYCAWTEPAREWRAYHELTAAGFKTYLPLHLHHFDTKRDHRSGYRIEVMFPRYLFTALDLAIDQWGAVVRTRGVAGLIRHALDQPTALPPGVVENLIERTSPRGIVDDPGDNAPHSALHAVQPPEWRNITSLGSSARVRLLCRLFGPDAAQRIVSEDETAHAA